MAANSTVAPKERLEESPQEYWHQFCYIPKRAACNSLFWFFSLKSAPWYDHWFISLGLFSLQSCLIWQINEVRVEVLLGSAWNGYWYSATCSSSVSVCLSLVVESLLSFFIFTILKDFSYWLYIICHLIPATFTLDLIKSLWKQYWPSTISSVEVTELATGLVAVHS